jgi:competence protein ComEC
VAVGLILGVWIDATWHLSLVVPIALFLTAGMLLRFLKNHARLWPMAIALAGFSVGAALHDLGYRHFRSDHIVRYTGHEPIKARVRGRIISQPTIQPPPETFVVSYSQPPRTRFRLSVSAIEGIDGPINVSGVVPVMIREPLLTATIGDEVEVFGWLYRAMAARNPGAADWRKINRRQGILVLMSASRVGNLARIERGCERVSPLQRLRRLARTSLMAETYDGDVPGSQLLSAMVLGQRGAVDSQLNDAFVKTGTVHYLAVSGAHVGIVASVVWLIGLAVGISRRGMAIWVIALVTLYALIAEPRPSILRAMWMVNLLCLALALRRPARTYNALAIGAIGLLMLRPTQLFEPGFQMSFVTVLAILLLAPALYTMLSESATRLLGQTDPLLRYQMQMRLNPSRRRAILHAVRVFLGWTLAIGISAWITGTLLGVYHFQQAAWFGWLNTILVMPLVWLVMVVGVGKAVFGIIVPWFATWIGPVLAGLTELLIAWVELLSTLPGSGSATPSLPLWLMLSFFAVLGLWVFRSRLRLSFHAATALSLLVIGLALWSLSPPPRSDALRMEVLSVGSGTCVLTQLPNGRTMLVDIGSFPSYDMERWTLGPILADRRIYDIDAVIVTHANLDHYGGLPELIDRQRVDRIITNPHFADFAKPGSAAGRVMKHVQQQGVPWEEMAQDDRLVGTGEVEFEVLWPPPPEAFEVKNANESSLVLRVTYEGTRVLLCGDIEAQAQEELLLTTDLAADVLLLPHHGDVEPTTEAFIDAVDPQYCIRSSGRRDAISKPELLEMMRGRTYFNTADDGAVKITISPNKVRVTPFVQRGSIVAVR